MYVLGDVPGQPVLPEVVGPDGEGVAVAVRDDERLLVQHREEARRQEVQQTREEHALDVRDQLGLPYQTIQASRLLKTL